MKFVSDILAKAGLVVDGVVTLNNTATGQTPAANDNSTKLATTAWVQNYVVPYSLPIASDSILGGIKVGTGLTIDASGILSISSGGGSSAAFRSDQTFVATAGQTTFTVTNGYTPDFVDVFLNGVYLNKTEYTATNGTTIILDDASVHNDIVTVFSYSPYVIGELPSARDICRITATAGQTTFLCTYAVGQIDVYYNGSKLDTSEYTATNGTSVILGTAAVAGDKIEIITWLVGGGISANRTITINGVTYDLSTNRTWSTLPTGGNAGQLLSKVDGSDYNVQWIDEAPAASYTSQVKHRVKSSQAITKGQAVYVSSADGTNMIVSKASNASEGTSSKTMGLLESTVSINGTANVVTEGLLAGLDTTGANAAGDPVWLGTNGDLIYGLVNKPVAPAHLVFIGVVTRRNANNGEIFVKVQNGFEMGELHDYVQTGVQNNDVISYESSTSLYKPKSIATLLGYTPANPANYLALTGGTLTGALSGTSANFSSLVTISADSGGSSLRLIGRAAADASAIRFFANNNTTQNARIESNSSEFEINSISSLPITLKTNDTTRLTIASTGAATFSSSVIANTGFEIPNGQFYRARRTSGNLLTDMIGIPSATNDVRILTTGAFNVVSGGLTTFLGITDTGVATFSSSVTGGAFLANGSVTVSIPIDTGASKAYFDASSINGPGLTVRADSVGRTIRLTSNATGSTVGAIDVNTNGLGIATNTSHPIIFSPQASERMRITNGGRVLIGTTSDTGVGGLGVSNTSFSGGANGLLTLIGGSESSIMLQTAGYGADTNKIGLDNSTGAFFFRINSAERMRITSGGSMLVGTTSNFSNLRLQVAGRIYTEGIVGYSYSQTSTSGSTSIVDTFIDNNSFGQSAMYMISYGGNPNAGGSGAYKTNYVGYISVATGWSGSNVTRYIRYTPVAQFDAPNVGALSLSVFFFNGTTETASINEQSTAGYYIRLKITGYNSSFVGSEQYVYLTRLN